MIFFSLGRAFRSRCLRLLGRVGSIGLLPIHKSGVLPDCAIFAADALLLATLFSKNVLGGTTASHTCLVWGAVIL